MTDLLDAPDPDAGLIVNGRYRIVPPSGGKAKLYTRVTNFAKEIDDTGFLMAWQKRMVMVGTAVRRELAAAALAAHPDKSALDALAEQAMDASGANEAREMGSALHKMCERADSGEQVDFGPFASDVDAYRSAVGMLGISMHSMEQVCVNEALGLAGRYDRLCEPDEDTLLVGDLKTGQNLRWGPIAIQLAIYASAETIYDPVTQTHSPMPPVDQDSGLVFHLPAGSGRCEVYEVDLEAGRQGIELVKQIKQFRKESKGFAQVMGL